MTSGISATRLLEAIRMIGPADALLPGVELGDVRRRPWPQHEETPLQPLSPYGAAQAYCYWMTRNLPAGLRHVSP
jgi:GDP-D-mannose dehydratase